MAKDMDFYMTEIAKIAQNYIKLCGNPRKMHLTDPATAEEIYERLGPITEEGHDTEQMMNVI